MYRFKLAALVSLVLAIGATPAGARWFRAPRTACLTTAKTMLTACGNDVRDELYTEKAKCLNLSDADARSECTADSLDASKENGALCGDQYDARVDFCKELGEDRYDPAVDPAAYDDDFANPSSPNPYYPLKIDDHWEFESDGEVTNVDVLDATKLIQGIPCVVVKDVVESDGEVTEDTDDWIALRLDGSVEYFGELSKTLETYPGDDPEDPELVDLEGSFKAGRDGAKKGTLFLASPAVGDVYREEWALGDAEDGARILSTNYGYGSGDPALDEYVPADLANYLCANDCVVTENFSPLEPEEDALEHKYYAPGIGVFLEVVPATGETTQLVGCNVDPKCATLP
jgi:hypothetical protein